MSDQNRIVPAPSAVDDTQPSISSRVHALALPLEGDPESGFKPHPLFRGSTPNLRSMSCHVSVLDPGKQPHPPHQHPEEEILIVLDGEVELVLEDATTAGVTRPDRAIAGTFAYYPAGSGGKLMRGTLDRRSPLTLAGNDQIQIFLVVRVEDKKMQVEAITMKGEVFETSTVERP